MNTDNLKNRDYYLILDKSGSMEHRDCANGKTRWEAAQESTLAIANRVNEYDPDGITVIPFSTSYKVYDNTTPSTVKNIFQENEPMGGTVLSAPLEHVFKTYLTQKAANKTKANGSLCIVVTDGEPSDQGDTAKAIVNFTKKLDSREEFGISFLQVGKDAQAAAFLKRLDDNLQSEGSKFDIVDTKTFDELENIGLTQALIAALTD